MKHDLNVGSLLDSTDHSIWNLCILVVGYGHFWTTYFSLLQFSSSPMKMGQSGCPETSVTNYESKVRKISEERRLYLHRSRSRKSRTAFLQRSVGLNPKKFPPFYGNNVHDRVHNRPPMVPNLSQMNPVHTLSHSTSSSSHLILSSYLRLGVQSRLFHTKTLINLSY